MKPFLDVIVNMDSLTTRQQKGVTDSEESMVIALEMRTAILVVESVTLSVITRPVNANRDSLITQTSMAAKTMK